ncbi:hypothetical protein DXG01_010681 [Tephrocybe rancida]|nr:hypothetical protein DXG01_010681 [Tephrocybe rancida]
MHQSVRVWCQLHTSETLAALQSTLDTFHAHKDIFIELKCCKDFNFPKLHSMMHYVEAIKALGSTDGYNSEAPERLHIDFAKDAYRASNKRDYTEQMAMWLQHREAMWMREGFCNWVVNGHADAFPIGNKGDSDDEGDGDGSDVELDEDVFTHVNPPPPSRSPSPDAMSQMPTYTITKCVPFKNVTLDCLASDFGAVDFQIALTAFIQANIPHANIFPNQFNCFNLYKQIIVSHPLNPYLGSQGVTSPKGRKLESPAHFDTTFIIENPVEYHAEGRVKGLCVAQVQAIFDLPPQFGFHPHPLTYIEWFTPLGRPDTFTGMHTIT